ncbi:SulP family inorganic anion transporter [Evansella sp. AB-rgal1]|uniref:SulP family inorganic anion transporter n=1 Tax=Evansella sp. AB-rgal1 TaxID=3242696 RepID=UPI00359DE7DA
MKSSIPAIDWIKNYNKDDLRGDISAGLIVAIMLIPQGMAYAMLAGIPPVIGLYAATVPLIIYALFGTSRQLAVGPVAMVSLLVLAGVSTIAEPGTNEYISLVLLLMLMIGLIQFFMGIFRLGFLVNFLSHSVISGFTSAAAIIIGLSQLKHLLGVPLQGDKDVLKLIFEVYTRFSEVHIVTFLIGITSIALLIVIKKLIPKIPAPLFIVGVSILLTATLQLDHHGVKIVGDVPQGLPSFSIPTISVESVLTLLPIAITISLIGFMESIAMAKAIAAKEKYKIVPNKELVGLGLANIGGSFFSGYPITGGFSRSAVNYQSGAKTQLATLITAFIIIATLLFFTGFFYYLPNAILAAIIMVAVYSLIDIKEAKHLFHIRPLDGWTWVITFAGTLLLGIEQGIIIGVLFSLLIYIWKSAYPHVAELGYLTEQEVYRNIKRYPHAKTDPTILIFRIDSDLFFANTTFLEEKLQERLLDKPNTKWVILDFTGVNSIDAVAIHSLEEIMKTHENQISFLFSGVKGPVRDLLKKAKWQDNLYSALSIDQALLQTKE